MKDASPVFARQFTPLVAPVGELRLPENQLRPVLAPHLAPTCRTCRRTADDSERDNSTSSLAVRSTCRTCRRTAAVDEGGQPNPAYKTPATCRTCRRTAADVRAKPASLRRPSRPNCRTCPRTPGDNKADTPSPPPKTRPTCRTCQRTAAGRTANGASHVSPGPALVAPLHELRTISENSHPVFNAELVPLVTLVSCQRDSSKQVAPNQNG